MASGQRMKKFSSQKEERVKFVPNKTWIPFRTQVSVQQVSDLFKMLTFKQLVKDRFTFCKQKLCSDKKQLINDIYE